MIIQTALIWNHMTNAGFSTSGQKPAAGRRGSAVWSAPAAEDFENKGWLSSTTKKATSCLKDLCAITGLLTRHVAEVVCSLIPKQCPKLPTWPRILVRLYYCHLCLQNTTNVRVSCPTCLIVISFLSPTLQIGTRNFSDSDSKLVFIWTQNGVKARLSWRLQYVAGMWAKRAAIIHGKSRVYF